MYGAIRIINAWERYADEMSKLPKWTEMRDVEGEDEPIEFVIVKYDDVDEPVRRNRVLRISQQSMDEWLRTEQTVRQLTRRAFPTVICFVLLSGLIGLAAFKILPSLPAAIIVGASLVVMLFRWQWKQALRIDYNCHKTKQKLLREQGYDNLEADEVGTIHQFYKPYVLLVEGEVL